MTGAICRIVINASALAAMLRGAGFSLLLIFAAGSALAQPAPAAPPIPRGEGVPRYINEDLARGDFTAMSSNADNAAYFAERALNDGGRCRIAEYRRNLAILDRLARLARDIVAGAGGRFPRVSSREAVELELSLASRLARLELIGRDCERRSLADQAATLALQLGAAALRCDRDEMRRLLTAIEDLLRRALVLAEAATRGEEGALDARFALRQYEEVRNILLAVRDVQARNCPGDAAQPTPQPPSLRSPGAASSIPPAEGIPLYINRDLARGDLTATESNAANAESDARRALADPSGFCRIDEFRRRLVILDRLARLASDIAEGAGRGGRYPRVDVGQARALAERLRRVYEELAALLQDCERRSFVGQAEALAGRSAPPPPPPPSTPSPSATTPAASSPADDDDDPPFPDDEAPAAQRPDAGSQAAQEPVTARVAALRAALYPAIFPCNRTELRRIRALAEALVARAEAELAAVLSAGSFASITSAEARANLASARDLLRQVSGLLAINCPGDDSPPFEPAPPLPPPSTAPTPPALRDQATALNLLDAIRQLPAGCDPGLLQVFIAQLETLLAAAEARIPPGQSITADDDELAARTAIRLALEAARARLNNCPEDTVEPYTPPAGGYDPSGPGLEDDISADPGQAAATPGNGLRFDVIPNYGGYALPPTGIGVTRAGPPGAAPELPAAATPDNVQQFGLDLGLSIDSGSVLAHGYYYEGSETRPFSRPTVAGTDTGRVNGALSPGGSSGVIGGFALDGSVASEGLAYGARVEIRVAETDDAPAPPRGTWAELRVYGEALRNESEYRGVVNGVIPGGFTFSQERDQEIGETRLGAGLAGTLTFTLGDGVTIVFDALAGSYYRDTSLESVERNRCSFCPVVDRDFTLNIRDDDNGFGLRGALGAGINYDLSPRVSVGLRGAVDYWSSAGRVFNPNSGDQVFFEGLTTGLRTDDTWRWRIGAGLTLRLPRR